MGNLIPVVYNRLFRQHQGFMGPTGNIMITYLPPISPINIIMKDQTIGFLAIGNKYENVGMGYAGYNGQIYLSSISDSPSPEYYILISEVSYFSEESKDKINTILTKFILKDITSIIQKYIPYSITGKLTTDNRLVLSIPILMPLNNLICSFKFNVLSHELNNNWTVEHGICFVTDESVIKYLTFVQDSFTKNINNLEDFRGAKFKMIDENNIHFLYTLDNIPITKNARLICSYFIRLHDYTFVPVWYLIN